MKYVAILFHERPHEANATYGLVAAFVGETKDEAARQAQLYLRGFTGNVLADSRILVGKLTEEAVTPLKYQEL